jgi:hypothetical protein
VAPRRRLASASSGANLRQPDALQPGRHSPDAGTEKDILMLKLGYKLMSEEHGPADLVRNARRAEEAGFEFAAISDHFFPWIEEQGHAPLAWSVLGAIAMRRGRSA